MSKYLIYVVTCSLKNLKFLEIFHAFFNAVNLIFQHHIRLEKLELRCLKCNHIFFLHEFDHFINKLKIY